MDVFTEATVPPHGPTVNSPASGGDAVLPCRGRPRTATTGSRPWRGDRDFYLLNAIVLLKSYGASLPSPREAPLSATGGQTCALLVTLYLPLCYDDDVRKLERRAKRSFRLAGSDGRGDAHDTRDVGMAAED